MSSTTETLNIWGFDGNVLKDEKKGGWRERYDVQVLSFFSGAGANSKATKGTGAGSADADASGEEKKLENAVREHPFLQSSDGFGKGCIVDVFWDDKNERVYCLGGNGEGKLAVFHVNTEEVQLIRQFTGHRALVRCACIFENGSRSDGDDNKRLVTGDDEGVLRSWRLDGADGEGDEMEEDEDEGAYRVKRARVDNDVSMEG